MRVFAKVSTTALLFAVFVCTWRVPLVFSSPDRQKEIEAFNRKFRESTLKMDSAAIMADWAEDGVDLIPGVAPMEGKKTIAKWLDEVVGGMPGYRVTKQENEFQDIQVCGDLATEWGTTYQVVQPPGDKPVIEVHGKILLVLHLEKNGEWKIKEEMWNAASNQ